MQKDTSVAPVLATSQAAANASGPDTHFSKRSAWLLWGGLLIVFAGALLAHFIQTAGGVRIQDVRFTGTNGTPMSAHLYIPASATSKTPAPGILAVHGYFNSREAQSGFAIEFARRGYVVLALDQTGHGYSAPPAFANAFGGIDGLKYLRSLDFVDKDNIGLEGHSMGGWTVVNAAAAMPDAYRALVLEGSSTGAPFAPEGTPDFPRNLAVVFSQYDEFPGIMWQIGAAKDVASSKKLWSVFGTDAPVETGKVYGSIEGGTARILHTPAITHPMDHISPTAIGHAIDWFQKTLKGGSPRPADDQVWHWKETGTAIALIGLIVFALGLFATLLRLPYFQSLCTPAVAEAPAQARDGKWWATVIASALVPALTFLPLCRLGGDLLPASTLLPSLFVNEIAFWALGNALIALIVLRVVGTKVLQGFDQIARSAVIALITFGVTYSLVAAVQFFLTVDMRFWFMAFKPMSAWQASAFPVYLLVFAVFFAVLFRAHFAMLGQRVSGAVGLYGLSVATFAGGFVLFLVVEYGSLLLGHKLIEFHMFDPLRIIIAINFVPVMAAVAIAGVFIYRRTARVLPAAFLCALFVTWYMVVGQAMQSAP